jgi:hypothetical protein
MFSPADTESVEDIGMRNQNLGIHGCVAALGVCMVACARDDVSLGDDIYEPVPPSVRCARDPLIDADVRVTNQAELDALAGCEEISGDLEIAVYPDTDLRPLASLRSVGGILGIGASSFNDLDQMPALIEAGWLESFEGLHALERVGGLSLANFATSDLSAFSNLRHANASNVRNGKRGGDLNIAFANNLVDLRGLEQVDGITSLSIMKTPSLASLDGLLVGRQLDSVALTAAPSLRDIDALAHLEVCNQIVIEGTGLEHLYALSALKEVDESLIIFNNPLLADASSIPHAQLARFGTFVLESNPKLRGTLEVPWRLTFAVVQIGDNAELEQIDFGGQRFPWCGGIFISGNAGLRSINGPIACDGLDGVTVTGNPSLESFDLEGVAMLDELHIRDNARLSNVPHASLERAYVVDVVNNPQLSVGSLATMPAFERTIEGNAHE